ncbi:hypothetical protein [Nocardioides stalactiti]|uniref:hypothetical protein n=1 Tax=Nocardioides stalactiti TaxID=2755356 RepID=UPI00160484C2|nr:hypothetical protein [Nocardioides stalactiti]
MSERPHRHPGGHLRRHGAAYALAALALTLSPVPSIAADLVTTADIATGAVTQPKLAPDSVVSGKILNETIGGVDIKNGSVTATDVAPLQWHDFVLLYGWVNANGAERPPGWAVDVQGVIHLRGAISGGATTAFARLPAAVRPSAPVYVVTNLDGSKPGRILVDPTGFLQADYEDTFDDAIAFTSLDGVTWAM